MNMMKKTMLKKSFTIIVLFIITKIYSQVVSSQSEKTPNYFSTSPNVASLGTFGVVPINLSTGSPNVNIDLLKFTTKGKEQSISLTYNLNSVKPEVPVQWTGLGWNLNVGGAITRNMNLFADESKSATTKGHYDNYSLYDNNNWYQNSKDDMPDSFLFEVNGINGAFYKNHKGKWIVSANQDVNFSITDETKDSYLNTYSGSKDRCIYGFEITDKYGNTYVFGKNDNALEISHPSINSSNGYTETSPTSGPYYIGEFVKSWYLTKIKYANGVLINFEYEPSTSVTFIQHFSISGGFASCVGACQPLVTSYEKASLKYLKRITFDEGSVEFTRSLANTLKYDMGTSYIPNFLSDYNNTFHWYKLNSIELLSKNNTLIDKVEFSYIENINERLKLKSLKISKDSQAQKKYTFSYNPLTMPALKPGKVNVDHWGFFNNKNGSPINTNNSLDMDNYYNLRESDSIAVRAETLERIDYPTGGYNIIEYEPNFYSKYVKNENNQISIADNSTNKFTGGLRVKKIKAYDSNSSTPTVKNYFYVQNYFNNQTKSSGVLSGIPKYIQEDYFDYTGGGFNFKNLTSTSFIPLSDTRGYHIGYSKVYEKNENGSITEYSYSNYDNGYNNNNPVYQSKKCATTTVQTPGALSSLSCLNINENIMQNSLSQERGLLLNKKDYDISGKLLKEIEIQFNRDPNRLTDEIRSFKFDFLSGVTGGPFSGYARLFYTKFTPYIVYSNAIQKIGEKTIDYFNSGNVTTETNYTFSTNFNNNAKKIVTKTSEGNLIEKRLFYAEDLNIGNQPQQYPVPYSFVPYMLAKNMTGIPLVTTNYKNNLFINRMQTIYQYFPEYTVNNDYVVHPKQELSYSKEDNLPNMGALTIPNITNGVKEITYDQYDNKGNLLQYTTNEDIPVTIIWGYNNTQPIAKIEGALYNNIKNNAKITSIISASDDDALNPGNEGALITSFDNLRTDDVFKDYQINTYTYDPLIGVTSITTPSGIREVYVYDSNKRLKEIRENSVSGNILKEYSYNYTPRKFYSKVIVNKSFTKNNCPAGMISSSVTYSVPAAKYESIIDQADADQQAENEGQNYANANLTCHYPYCTMTPTYLADIYYSSFQEVSSGHVKVILSLPLTNSSGGSTPSWSNGVFIGTLDSPCRPSSYKNISVSTTNGSWNVSIAPSGGITLMSTSGSTPSSSVTLNFEYDKN